MLVLKIICETIFVILLFFLCNAYMQSRKCDNFIFNTLYNRSFLKTYIVIPIILDTIPPIIKFFFRPNLAYEDNLKLYMDDHNKYKSIARFWMIFVMIIILIISYFMGIIFLIVSCASLFFLYIICSFIPISNSAQTNGLQYIQTMGYIIWQWLKNNEKEVEVFANAVPAFQYLYHAFKNDVKG
jgi:hypothetical protein